tara:strand:+ start:362 stop:1393 length:1032 start_codon:yes stop_codon:yes gene_type:complete
MAPFKSTQSFSVGQFLKTFRNRDGFGPAALNSTVRTKRSISLLNVPTGVHPSGLYDLSTTGRLLLASTGTYDISLNSASSSGISLKVHIWGAGGGAGTPLGGPGGGGAGGFTVGDYEILPGTTYKYVVGSSDGTPGNPGQPAPGDGPAGDGGGYSGIFTTSVSQPNAIMMAGGGGGTGYNDGGTMGSGGGGGGATAQDGYSPNSTAFDARGRGGTQSAGGVGGTGSSPGPNGAALQGGSGGPRGGSGAGGGGGGSGYFGGGGGAGQTSINSGGGGGGGGSGYLHPSIITNGTTTTASGATRITTSPYTPIIPATASKGNDQSNSLSLPAAARGGSGCIVIEVA